MKVYEQSLLAQKSREEIILPQDIIGEKSIRKREEDKIDLKSSLITLKEEITSIHRDKRKWTTVLLLSTASIAVLTLDATGKQSLQVGLISYLLGGERGSGIFQTTGWMVSRAVYSYFMVSTLIPILLGEYRFQGWKKGLKRIREINYKKESNIIMILLGLVVSMYVYNFLSGKALFKNSMIGLILTVMTFKVYISDESMVKLQVERLILRAKRTDNICKTFSDRLLLGMGVGFLLSVVLSGLNIFYTSYFVGTFILIGVLAYLWLEYKR